MVLNDLRKHSANTLAANQLCTIDFMHVNKLTSWFLVVSLTQQPNTGMRSKYVH